MPPRHFVGRLTVVAAFLLVVLPRSDAHAATAAVRLRWRGSPDASVVGYHVYVRPLDGAYGTPRDAGMPPALPDGTLSVVVNRLDARTAYAFALSAYTATGAESGLSNELTLTAARRLRCSKDADCADSDACTDNERCEAGRCVTDPHVCVSGDACVEAMCDATQGCVTHDMPDGATCTDGDPCVAGACAAGACVIPAEAEAALGTHELRAKRFTLRRHRSGRMLAAAGAFDAAGLDPHANGLVVQVLRADGGVLFEADVAGARVRRVGRRRWSWIRNAYDAGLRSLRLRWDGTLADVRLKAVLPSNAADTPLTWAVHMAGVCVRAPDLVCTPDGPRVTTCE
jgi:hypothetical protein